MLSNKLTNYHEDALSAYRDWVKNYSRYNTSVETAPDYLQEKGVLPTTAAGTQSKDLAEELVPADAFHLFYRIAPGSNQRTMIIAENPRFQSYSREWYEEEEGSELLSTNGDVGRLAEVGRHRLLDYLLRTEGSSSNHWADHISAIFEHIHWLEDFSGEVDEELRQNPDRFYNEIYYTNAWKFATPNGISHSKGRAELAHPLLHKEIEIIDPELLVICSGSGWRFTTGQGVTSAEHMPAVEVESLDGSPIDSLYDGTGPNKSAGGVFEVNGRVAVTAKHPGRFGADGTRQALKRAEEHL